MHEELRQVRRAQQQRDEPDERDDAEALERAEALMLARRCRAHLARVIAPLDKKKLS